MHPRRTLRLYWIFVLVLALHCALVMASITTDNTGLLARTLFTFQQHACEEERLHIRCPYGTTISIQWAQYGRQLPTSKMCTHMGALRREEYGDTYIEDTSCLATTSLRIVLDACQDQRTCKLRAAAETFGEDPCPGTSKYLEVAFKCRPNEFRSRISCENDDMLLQCKKSRRIAIYSAEFGRLERSAPCPSGSAVDLVCAADCALEKVVSRCHGHRHCTIPATAEMFGDPCLPGTNKYLSVVYTCVPKRIMKEIRKFKDESYPNSFCDQEITWGNGHHDGKNRGKTDFPLPRSTDSSHSEWNPQEVEGAGEDGEAGFVPKPSTFDYSNIFSPMTPPPELDDSGSTPNNTNVTGVTSTTPCVTDHDETVVAVGEVRGNEYLGVLENWMSTMQFIDDNLEKFILYVVVCVLVGTILLLLVIILRLVIVHRRRNRRAKLEISGTVAGSPSSNDEFPMLDGLNNSDGVEIISINQNRPPPFRTDSLRSSSDYRTDTANRSIHNYYG